jgi:hypothetical protein
MDAARDHVLDSADCDASPAVISQNEQRDTKCSQMLMLRDTSMGNVVAISKIDCNHNLI